jgi:hypothetical protein
MGRACSTNGEKRNTYRILVFNSPFTAAFWLMTARVMIVGVWELG